LGILVIYANYNLHILLRFDLERLLINNEINTRDLPSLWDQYMQNLLGLKPHNMAEGLLQDIHWSLGYFGYFPTYTLGNVIAAQLAELLNKEMQRKKEDINQSISQARFNEIALWLKEKVHQHGSLYRPKELIKKIFNQQVNASYWLKYIKEKFKEWI